MVSTSQREQTLLPSVIQVRPLLMLTGFLGAGKTTLLRSLLGELSNRNHLADVILNDRENAEIDSETLRGYDSSIAALSGSCVCCDGIKDLHDLILEASKTKHPVLLIELNGTADPLPLQETFTLLESKFCLRPRWQVCVIDPRYFGNRAPYNELEKLQLETASHYYISHNSYLTQQREDEIEEQIKIINPGASRTNAFQLANALDHAIQNNRRHTIASTPKTQWSEPFPTLTADSPQHHDRHQLAHEFTGCNIIIPEKVNANRLQTWLESLPDSVIRTKALVTLDTDSDCRFLYERVNQEISPCPIPVRSISKVPCSALFIGPELNPEQLLQLTRKHLHHSCHLNTTSRANLQKPSTAQQ